MRNQNDIREALYQGVLPESRTVQYLLSLLTGKSHLGQSLPERSPWRHLFWSSAALLAGIGLSLYAVTAAHWALLPLGWLSTLYGARFWQLVIVHHSTHQNFVRKPRLDEGLGRLLSVLLLIEPFEQYRRRHVREHHPRRFLSTAADPSVHLLKRAGLEDGLPVSVLKRRLLWALISPAFHLRQLRERLMANLQANAGTRAAFGLYLLALGGLAVQVGGTAFALAFVLPLTLFYQQAQLLRICVEHLRAEDDGTDRSQAQMAVLTQAIFLGSPPPQDCSLGAWSAWTVKMLGHLLVRLVVLPGESGAAHDYHHFQARGDWANYMAARRRHQGEFEALGKGHLYREVWGYPRALTLSLASISRLPGEAAEAQAG